MSDDDEDAVRKAAYDAYDMGDFVSARELFVELLTGTEESPTLARDVRFWLESERSAPLQMAGKIHGQSPGCWSVQRAQIEAAFFVRRWDCVHQWSDAALAGGSFSLADERWLRNHRMNSVLEMISPGEQSIATAAEDFVWLWDYYSTQLRAARVKAAYLRRVLACHCRPPSSVWSAVARAIRPQEPAVADMLDARVHLNNQEEVLLKRLIAPG